MRLVQGVYRYADYENLLRVLKDLCGSEETQAEILIPAIIRWLYEDQAYVLPQQILPRSKREREKQPKTFGQRLDKVMTLLELTNARLAAGLNIDVSMISRYRSGIYHPRRNKQIREHVCELLSARAEKRGMTAELAALCGVPAEKFGNEKLAEWLYSQDEDFSSEIAESVFRSIDTYAPGQGIPSPPPTLPKIQETDCYWGTPGIRQAVIRFLSDAAREGGRLLLYSDEPMDWMSGDREFFAVWTSLMNACVNAGVQIKIIHNLDRSGQEMIAAMAGWLPLYISGKIEPYVLRKNKDPRFFHTIFLRPGRAAVLGFFPADAGENRWYGYITDPDRLNALQAGYHTMLIGASPFLRTYPAAKMDDFWDLYRSRPEKKYALL